MNLNHRIHAFLAEHGPSRAEAIHGALRIAGHTTARTPDTVLRTLQSSAEVERLTDGLWDLAARRLVGCVLTTRPRAVIRDGELWVHRDLEPLDDRTAVWRAQPAGFLLTSGGIARWGRTSIPTLVGPPGWLPVVEPGQLLALRWDGTSLGASVPTDVPAADSAHVRRARELLALHAGVPRSLRGGSPGQDLRATVLSALREDPDLLREPLPPLSELLPLPEMNLDDEDLDFWAHRGSGRQITLRPSDRVLNELERRAELLGDRTEDYASMLLGAAVDRIRPTDRRRRLDDPWYADRPPPYDDFEEDPFDLREQRATRPDPSSTVTPLRRR